MRKLLVGLSLALVACGDGNGQDVGVFFVTGTLQEACTAEGFLAAPTSIQGQAWLRRVGADAMHYDDGSGRMIGLYEPSDRSFALGRSLKVELSAPSCTVLRQQSIQGRLDADPETAKSFEGELRFDYAIADDSFCEELPEEEAAIVAAVPCVVSYELSAERD